MASTTPVTRTVEQPKYYRLLAPWWHTLILVGIMLLASMGQANTLGEVVHRYGRLPIYTSTMLYEWIMVSFVWLGVHRRGIRLRDLIGGRWKSPEDFLLDIGLALGVWIVLLLITASVRLALGQISLDPAKNMEKAREIYGTFGFFAPQGMREIVFYIALCATAGFCEEVIFRGYLQKQFHAATRSALVGILAQGVLFGAVHGYQGLKGMALIVVIGIVFGSLAFWRRSLRPGMMTHAWLDFFTGILLGILGRQLR